MTFAVKTFHHCLCMAAVSKCGIKSGFSRLDLQKIQDFLHHNGNMHASRCIPFADHMFDRILIFLRVQFFVLFFKFFRIFSFISYTPFVWLWCLLLHKPLLMFMNTDVPHLF